MPASENPALRPGFVFRGETSLQDDACHPLSACLPSLSLSLTPSLAVEEEVGFSHRRRGYIPLHRAPECRAPRTSQSLISFGRECCKKA